jgi:hypothetical protein
MHNQKCALDRAGLLSLAGLDETPGGCHSCNLANLLQADTRPDSNPFLNHVTLWAEEP